MDIDTDQFYKGTGRFHCSGCFLVFQIVKHVLQFTTGRGSEDIILAVLGLPYSPSSTVGTVKTQIFPMLKFWVLVGTITH